MIPGVNYSWQASYHSQEIDSCSIFSPLRLVAASSLGASLANAFAMSRSPAFETPGSTAGSPELTFAQKMAARLRSGGTQPGAVVNAGDTPVESESSSNVSAGIRNLFAGGVGAGARFGMGIVSSNLGSSWDANSSTILGSEMDKELTLAAPESGTLSTLGLSSTKLHPR